MADVRFRFLNRKNREEVARVVTDYDRSPLEWDPGHVVEDVRIEREVAGLMAPEDGSRRHWIEVAIDESDEIVAHHWVRVEGEGEYRIATIISLFVRPEFRKQGIARRLKEYGEAWAREQGAVRMKTTVHLKNTGMLALNESLGFERGMVQMTKEIR